MLYSATKYLGGHDDIAGSAALDSAELIQKINFYLGLYCSNLGATESWLLARSLRTLPLRVRKMSENILILVDSRFEGNSYGGMLCVNFRGSQAEIDRLIENLTCRILGNSNKSSKFVAKHPWILGQLNKSLRFLRF